MSHQGPAISEPFSAHANRNANSTLLSLPVEIYELVQKDLLLDSRFITRDDVLRNECQLDGRGFEYRADILKPLMHTCHALRAAYIPAYYEHVETCIAHAGKFLSHQPMVRLEKTANILMDPLMRGVAAHVRVMTVSFTDYNDTSVIPLFASCLEVLANLHTLQITHVEPGVIPLLERTFESRCYNQISTIVLPGSAQSILRACPDVKDVTCNDAAGAQLLGAIDSKCRKVESVAGIDVRPRRGSVFRKALPNVRDVTFHGIYGPTIKELAGLQSISVIRIVLTFHKSAVYGNLSRYLNLSVGRVEGRNGHVEEAKAVLAASGTQQPKFVEVTWQLAQASPEDSSNPMVSEVKTSLLRKTYAT